MIRVTVVRDSDNDRIAAYTLLGHAEFAKPGKDIVCAGVSTVAFGTVNSIEELLGIELPCTTHEKEGRFEVLVPEPEDAQVRDRLQLLLESMVVMLRSLEESYGRYISIETINEKRR